MQVLNLKSTGQHKMLKKKSGKYRFRHIQSCGNNIRKGCSRTGSDHASSGPFCWGNFHWSYSCWKSDYRGSTDKRIQNSIYISGSDGWRAVVIGNSVHAESLEITWALQMNGCTCMKNSIIYIDKLYQMKKYTESLWRLLKIQMLYPR